MYGIVLVLDPDNAEVEIPVTGDTCSSTSSCVSVPVRAYVDGPVSLWLGPAADMPAGVQIFSGPLDTPSGRLTIELPEEDDEPLSVDVAAPRVEVTIAIDDPNDTAAVWVGQRVAADAAG